MRQGNLDQAEEYFNGALHVTPKTAPVLSMLANVAQKRGDLGKALKLYQEALDSDPKLIKAALGLGKILLQSKRYEDARQVLVAALKYNPNSNEVRILLSRILQKMDRSGEAIDNIKKLLDRDSSSWSAYYFKALIHLQCQEYDQAIRDANNSLRIQPDNPRATMCLSQALIETEQYKKAIHVLRDVLAENPDMWNAKMQLARAYFSHGDLEEAKALLNKMAAGRRGLGPVHFLMGEVLEAQGHLSLAVVEYEAGVLHSERLTEESPQLKEFVDKEMPLHEKISEFKKIVKQAQKKGFDSGSDDFE